MTKQIRIYLFLFLATLLAGLPAYGKVGSGIITMTTAKEVGEEIRLAISADGGFTIEGVWGRKRIVHLGGRGWRGREVACRVDLRGFSKGETAKTKSTIWANLGELEVNLSGER